MATLPSIPQIQALIDSQDFNSAKMLLLKVLDSPSSPSELLKLSQLFYQVQDFHSCRTILASVLSDSQDPEILEQANCQLKQLQMSFKGKEEHEEFGNLVKSAELQEGALWHIVSKTWLTAWENSIFWAQSHPGVISNKDLIDDFEILQDPRPHKKYTNLVLKPEVSEKVNYELIPKAAYSFLQQRYSEDETVLKRWCISLAEDGSGLHIEIRLKPISVLIIPKTTKSLTILMSRIETILNLKEKIISIWPDLQKYEFRVWISNKTENFQDLQNTQRQRINGKLVNEKTMIEDCEIAENNLVVVEFKFKTEWILYRADEICNYCKNSGKLKHCSVCKIIKYCSRECQVSDFKQHKELCKKVQESKNLRSGLVGLQNLGFTCFMNSALQCVIHTQKLRDYFLSGKYLAHLNTNNPLGTTNAALAKVFAELLETIWLSDESVIAPWGFKKVISKFAPQFIGYDQHDAHELLTFLLSGLHEDLNQVIKKPYIEKPEVENLPDPEASLNSWNWFLLRNKSLLVDFMYGQVKSSLKCPKCQKQSFTFDPFLTLSVNIPNTHRISFKIKLVNRNLQVFKQAFSVYSNTSVSKVRNLLTKKFSVKNLIVFYYNDLNVQGICDESHDIGEYLKKKLIAFECLDDMKNCSLVFLKIFYLERGDKVLSGFTRLLFFKKSDAFQKVHKYLKLHLPNGYCVNIVNTSVYTGFFNKSRLPCVFCAESNCSNCPLPRSKMTLEEAGEKIGSDAQLTFEIIYNTAMECLAITVNQKTDEISDNFVYSENLKLESCIDYTMNPETLDSQNEWFCSGCKSHVQALKTLQLYLIPEILIIHLVRFRTRGIFSQKNTDFVEFPLENLDLSRQTAGKVLGKYDLYAVCNHYGGLGGGHYTATVVSGNGWYDLDDSKVSRISAEKMPNYGEPDYWEKRYKEQKDRTFDWLEDFNALKPILTVFLTENSKVLNLGCGNSTLSEELFGIGFKNIANIDISTVVIGQMRERCKALEEMTWDVMDCKSLGFGNELFDVVIDKSTMDALLCGDNAYLNVAMMTKEVQRVLKVGGVYLMISYGIPDNRIEHLQWKHLWWDIEIKTINPGSNNPHFLFICIKKQGADQICEENWEEVQKILREEDEDLISDDETEEITIKTNSPVP